MGEEVKGMEQSLDDAASKMRRIKLKQNCFLKFAKIPASSPHFSNFYGIFSYSKILKFEVGRKIPSVHPYTRYPYSTREYSRTRAPPADS